MNHTRRKLSELSDVEREGLYRKLFETVDGQLVLEDIKESGYCYQTTAQDQGRVVTDTDIKIREGMRIMALLIDKKSTSPYQPEVKPEE